MTINGCQNDVDRLLFGFGMTVEKWRRLIFAIIHTHAFVAISVTAQCFRYDPSLPPTGPTQLWFDGRSGGEAFLGTATPVWPVCKS